MKKENIRNYNSVNRKFQQLWNVISLILLVGGLYCYFFDGEKIKNSETTKCEFGQLDTSYIGKHSIKTKSDLIFERPRILMLPKKGCVQTSEMAIKLALLYWKIDYERFIDSEKPFATVLYLDSVWHVSGTLPKGEDGGTVYIEIQKKDGKVLNMTHYK